MTQAVDRLVQHVNTTRFEDLPGSAVAAVKTFCLDTIGVSVAGTTACYAAEVRTAVGQWGLGEEATVLGVGPPASRRLRRRWSTLFMPTIRSSTACTRPRWYIR